MTNPTSNFGWQMPTATDLVTDLPADFAVFGQAVDTSMADLKGGTTGQVLSKTTNTDMDFTWVTTDDTNAIQNAIVDAKGDLIAATAADTPARLAVGTDGQVLTASSGAATGLAWATPSAGALTKIQTSTLSAVANSSTTFDGVFTSTYKKYIVVFDGMFSSGSQQLLFQFRISGVTRSAGYYGTYNNVPYNGSITTTGTNAGSSCPILNLQNSTGPAGLTLNFRAVGNSTQQGQFYGVGFDQVALGPIWEGYENNTGAINTGFILSVASGTFTGTVTVYGLEN